MKIEILPSKKVVPKLIPYLCSALYIAIVVFAIIAIVSKKWWLFGVDVAIYVSLLIIDKSFSWFVTAELFGNANKILEYVVTDPIDVLGRNKTRYVIKSIDKIERTKQNVRVFGNIELHAPMQKAKTIKKCLIVDADDKAEDFIRNFYS